MALRMAFAGFRHAHITEVYALAKSREDLELVAAAEDHAETRGKLAVAGDIEVTHESTDAMFDAVEFDVLAVGDYYGRRGELIVRALEAGRHVIVDKPACTSLDELDRIAALASEKGLSVGCQLNMRNGGNFIAFKQVVADGLLGEVHTIDFQGQHPLMYGSRPMWYFEPGKHGGTINDIAIHAVDIIPWMTGRKVVEVAAARVWNAGLSECDFFQDGAQLMLAMDNGGGVLGDVGYFQPNNFAYKVPVYWRVTVHGTKGLAETSSSVDGVSVWSTTSDEAMTVPAAPARPAGYLDDFLAEVRGEDAPADALTTAAVLDATRRTLLIQQAADEGRTGVALE